MSVKMDDLPLSPPDNPDEALYEKAEELAQENRANRKSFDEHFGQWMCEKSPDVEDLLWAIEVHMTDDNASELPSAIAEAYGTLMGDAYEAYKERFVARAKSERDAERTRDDY